MKVRFFAVFTLAAVIWLASSGITRAQEESGEDAGPTTSARTGVLPDEQLENLVIKRDPKVITDGYIETTFQNLVNAYWAVAKFDIDDDKAIDNYMMITNCDIYKQYFTNDFEWDKIRGAARQYLTKNAAKLPTRFEAILPIKLDKYDPQSQQFKIAEKYQQRNLVRVDVLTNSEGQSVCNYRGIIPLYPRNIIVLLNRPFTIKSFPVSPEIAELYMKEVSLQPLLKHENQDPNRNYDPMKNRIAYLRLKLKLEQYKETISFTNFDRAVIYAYLEGVDVFADEAETKPLYTSQFKRKESQTRLKPVLQAAPPKEYSPKDVGSPGK